MIMESNPQFRTVSRTVTTPIFNGGAARITIDQVEEQVPVMFPMVEPMMEQDLVDTDEAVFGDLDEYEQDMVNAPVEEEQYVPYDDTMEPEEDMIDDPSVEFDQDYL